MWLVSTNGNNTREIINKAIEPRKKKNSIRYLYAYYFVPRSDPLRVEKDTAPAHGKMLAHCDQQSACIALHTRKPK